MALRATIVDPLVDELPAGWDPAVAAMGLSPLWRSRVLTRLAWCSPQPARLAIVADGLGLPLALFCARHLGLVRRLRHRFSRPHDRPGWGFVGCSLLPGTTLAGHALRPGLAPSDQAEAIDAFEQAVRHQLGWRGRPIVYRQVRAGSLPAFDRRGRVVRAIMPEFCIENRWTSFDEYLRELPAPHRREVERLRRRVVVESGVTTALEDAVTPGDLSRLVQMVRRRHEPGTRALPWPAVYGAELGRIDSVRYRTFRDPTGRLLALAQVVDDGSALRWHAWGQREPVDGGRTNLYVHCMAALVGDLIARGAERLLLGKTMEPLKRRFGGQPVPLYAVASLR